jgi:hypothetical protein
MHIIYCDATKLAESPDQTGFAGRGRRGGRLCKDEAAVTDGKIVTSRGSLDLAAFIHAFDDSIELNRR